MTFIIMGANERGTNFEIYATLSAFNKNMPYIYELLYIIVIEDIVTLPLFQCNNIYYIAFSVRGSLATKESI